MATRTIADGGGNWTANGTWVEGAKPTASDDVVATATSGSVVIDATSVCRSADFTGYLGTISGTAALNIGTSSKPASAVAIKLVPGMGWTHTGAVGFVSTVTGNTITFAGKTLNGVTFTGAGGGWTFQDAASFTGTTAHTAGTLDFNSQAITCASFASNGSGVRTLTWGTTVMTTTGTTLNFSGTNLTLSAASSTINFARTSTTQTFTPAASQTWGTFNVNNAAGFIIATTATTITNLNITPTAAITVTLPAGVTTTITNPPTLLGIPGKLLTIVSSTGGSAATLSVASGTIRANHASIKDSTATGGATFNAYDSINVSGNTGWTFVAAKKMALAGVG